MDPEACVARLDGAITDQEWPEAVQALDAYYQWRLKGGFEPEVRGIRNSNGVQGRGDTVVSHLAAALADALER